MNKIEIEVTFNYVDRIVVNASNEYEAEILAKAERIKENKSTYKLTSYRRITE